jgi:hypothetical protein
MVEIFKQTAILKKLMGILKKKAIIMCYTPTQPTQHNNQWIVEEQYPPMVM